MKTLGEKIRELREGLDLSLREFARQLGVSAPFWSDVELGRRHPSSERLEETAKILGVTVEELKEYDTRPPVQDLRRLSSADPAFGLAFRRAIDAGVNTDDLMKLVKEKRKAAGKKKNP